MEILTEKSRTGGGKTKWPLAGGRTALAGGRVEEPGVGVSSLALSSSPICFPQF